LSTCNGNEPVCCPAEAHNRHAAYKICFFFVARFCSFTHQQS
jgi:hypothetical protein